MISYLKGKLAAIGENTLVVDVGGIGYEVVATAAALRAAGAASAASGGIQVFTHMSVREDAITLFGFASIAEKEIFLHLISVSGIGPKMAVAVLSGIGESELTTAIASGDSARLGCIKGIGKKTAERIVLELKDKIAGKDFGELATAQPQNQDAVLALVSMGFSRQEAAAAIAKVKNADKLSLEEIIINSLKDK